MKTKYLRFLAALSTLVLLYPLGALARDKNEHSVSITVPVEVGSTQLVPGHYEVEWQGDGPGVQVSFLQKGQTVATVPGTLKSNDQQITQDDIVTDSHGANSATLKEIDFNHQKEALIFNQGMNQ